MEIIKGIDNLESYNENKLREIEEVKNKLNKYIKDKDECKIALKYGEIKLQELYDKECLTIKEAKDILYLEGVIKKYREYIMTLCVEIEKTNALLEDLKFDYEMTNRECELLETL